ncbi:glycerol-3-phosphate acyltransferase PlsY [Thermomonas hydrothermalis]|uniref:Glycerol-3-phosphate acyltransferase n=2 Tax=Thermomonas hydrothermalis TaxID=213588 RepID=A0A1M4TJG4_9GAMM|nr:glycerol-3-phosphate acyltransferase PlsY [Thermomonas hydrothermalis]
MRVDTFAPAPAYHPRMDARLMITIAVLLAAYLLGSVSGSLLLGRLRGIDIRQHGSGNAGGTNALRTLGWRFALAVVSIDIGKGALAVWLALWLAPAWAYTAAALAVAGHVWPLWHGFRGGKGAATAVGALLVLWPQAVLPLLVVWLLVLVLSGYVGLATVLAALALPVWVWWQRAGVAPQLFALWLAVFLTFTHRSNLSRLRRGCESRFERARLLHRWWTRA